VTDSSFVVSDAPEAPEDSPRQSVQGVQGLENSPAYAPYAQHGNTSESSPVDESKNTVGAINTTDNEVTVVTVGERDGAMGGMGQQEDLKALSNQDPMDQKALSVDVAQEKAADAQEAHTAHDVHETPSVHDVHETHGPMDVHVHESTAWGLQTPDTSAKGPHAEVVGVVGVEAGAEKLSQGETAEVAEGLEAADGGHTAEAEEVVDGGPSEGLQGLEGADMGAAGALHACPKCSQQAALISSTQTQDKELTTLRARVSSLEQQLASESDLLGAQVYVICIFKYVYVYIYASY
jgi:hypothetical protein